MKAIVRERYGSPDVLELRELPKPVAAADEVLVRVRAVSVNPAEWYAMDGPLYVRLMMSGLFKPKSIRLGGDFSGVVEAVGTGVTDFQPGDEVFGGRGGAFAEYLTVRQAIVHKPANVTLEQAAAVPTAGLTALQGLRDHGQLQPGQRVLVTGAAGGVGSFAVQVAKALGAAHVTGVCRTQNVELVRSLGADEVVDYTREDFTRTNQPYDLVLEIAGTRPWADYRRIMKPDGVMVIVGAPRQPLVGPLARIAALKLASRRASQKMPFFVAQFNRPDLATLAEMMASGKLRPVIDRSYPLSQIGEAMRYLGEMHARGKIVVTIP